MFDVLLCLIFFIIEKLDIFNAKTFNNIAKIERKVGQLVLPMLHMVNTEKHGIFFIF